MFAFIFGSTNPQRVAERQLNRAKLDHLEVCGALETYEAQRAALETRIERLTNVVAVERGEVAPTPVAKTERKERSRSALSVAPAAGLVQEA